MSYPRLAFHLSSNKWASIVQQNKQSTPQNTVSLWEHIKLLGALRSSYQLKAKWEDNSLILLKSGVLLGPALCMNYFLRCIKHADLQVFTMPKPSSPAATFSLYRDWTSVWGALLSAAPKMTFIHVWRKLLMKPLQTPSVLILKFSFF